MKAKIGLMGILCPRNKMCFVFLLLFWSLNTLAQNTGTNQLILNGTVFSKADRRPLQGASIRTNPSTIKTITDKDGSFTLTIGNLTKGTLIVSYVGFQTKEIAFTATQASFTIEMEVDEKDLEEVEISTGYQNFNPERFVGSAAKLDSTNFHRRAGMGIIERLRGTVTGLGFTKNDNPDNLPIIRGVSTLSNTAFKPLVVVDNFPMDERFDLNTINPNDVLDITVLKDAVAASIWGSLAGNGVIVITTKKGKRNQPFSINASSNIGITEKPDLYYYPRMSIDEVIEVERFLFGEGFYKVNLDNTTTRPFISPVVELLNQMTMDNKAFIDKEIEKLSKQDIRQDLDKFMYRDALRQQHHLSFNGGNQFGGYAFSAGYNRDLSNLQHSKASDQFTIRSQNNFRPTKNLTIEAGVMLSKNINRKSNSPTLPQIPYLLLADENGNALTMGMHRLSYLEGLSNGDLLDWQFRPLDEIRFSNNNQRDQFVTLNLSSTYTFLPWLKGTVRFQHQQSTNQRKDYFSEETYFTRNLINAYSYYDGGELKYNIPKGGILEVGNSESLSNQFRGQFDIHRQWQNKHVLSGVIASDISRVTSPFNTGNRFYGYNIDRDIYATVLNYEKIHTMIDRIGGTSARIPQSVSAASGVTSNRVSFLGYASYTYDKRYTFYGSARKDGANVFGVHTNNKWKPLWSAGGSWDITNESFFNIPKISYLRLRGSYGYMGNTTGGTGYTLMVYNPYSVNNLTEFPQASLNSPPNPDLRWEEIRMINGGIDFNILDGRISGSIEGFRKRSKDIVSLVPSDPTLGVDFITMNSASLQGKGMEINLSSQNLKGALEWNTNLGYSYVKTIVTELYNGGFSAQDFLTYNLNAAVDHIAYGLSSYRWAGLDPSNGDPRGYLDGEISKDYKGIGNDDIENQVFHGSSLPLHFGFLSNSVSYKNITLSVNINFSFDYYFRKPSIEYVNLFNNLVGHVDYKERWQEVGDETRTNVPSMIYPMNTTDRDEFYKYSEVNVLKGDHIRLRDLRLQYHLDHELINRLSFKSIQLFMYLNNLNVMLWRANKSGLDPDYIGGTNYFNSPPSKSWTFGLNLNL